jgi:hypothetical protein
MTPGFHYLEQIQDLIQANGWEGQLVLEVLDDVDRKRVRVRLGEQHPTAPLEVINEYDEFLNPLEQVQQECLRALRTGRPGI